MGEILLSHHSQSTDRRASAAPEQVGAAVKAAKRAQKEEIAHWFAIWLETPDTFFDWLEVRRQSPDFQQRFGDRALDEI